MLINNMLILNQQFLYHESLTDKYWVLPKFLKYEFYAFLQEEQF